MSNFDNISLGMLFNHGYLSPSVVVDLLEQSDKSAIIRSSTPEKKPNSSNLPASIGPLVACCEA